MSKTADKLQSLLEKWITKTFQLDRLDELASGSIFIKAAYAELIANINYAMLHEPAVGNEMIVIAGRSYPLTLPGRKAAIAESFRHMANKLDDFLSTSNVSNMLGMMDMVADLAKVAIAKA